MPCAKYVIYEIWCLHNKTRIITSGSSEAVYNNIWNIRPTIKKTKYWKEIKRNEKYVWLVIFRLSFTTVLFWLEIEWFFEVALSVAVLLSWLGSRISAAFTPQGNQPFAMLKSTGSLNLTKQILKHPNGWRATVEPWVLLWKILPFIIILF